MTIDHGSSKTHALTDFVNAALAHAGAMGPTTIVTRTILIVQTMDDGPDGEPHYDVHRVRPHSIDPSAERGLLRDALKDADAERHSRG